MPRGPRRLWMRVGVVLAAVTALAVALLGFAGGYGYARLQVVDGCADSPFAEDEPDDYSAPTAPGAAIVDVEPYRIADAREVVVSPRGSSLALHAWYAPPSRADGPVVVVSHGVNSCGRDPLTLLPAGMLHWAGFGVLVVDLRNHGDSDDDDGRSSLGGKESDDLLGAWDWLVGQGDDPARIGMFGTSLSAAAAIDALGVEPRLAAVWADSSFANVDVLIGELTEQSGFPPMFGIAVGPVGRLLGEPSLGTRSPDRALASLAGRPLAIVHGRADTFVAVHHATDLARAAAAAGSSVTPWIVDRAGHQEAVVREPAAYEARLVAFFCGALGAP